MKGSMQVTGPGSGESDDSSDTWRRKMKEGRRRRRVGELNEYKGKNDQIRIRDSLQNTDTVLTGIQQKKS